MRVLKRPPGIGRSGRGLRASGRGRAKGRAREVRKRGQGQYKGRDPEGSRPFVILLVACAELPKTLLYPHGSAGTGEGRASVSYGRGSGELTAPVVA